MEADKELQRLKAIEVDKGRVDQFFHAHPPHALEAFHSLLNFSRKTYLQLDFPEIFLLTSSETGAPNCSIAVVEAFLGHRLLSRSKSIFPPFHRTFRLVLNYVPDCSTPRVTLRRDVVLPGTKDTVVPLEQLPDRLIERNVESDEPVVILYECDTIMNVTFVLCPSLLPDDHPQKQQVDEKLCSLAASVAERRPPLLLLVEKVGNWPSWVVDWVRKSKLDPRLERTAFVWNDCHEYFKCFHRAPDINKFLLERPPYVDCFFVSVPSEELRGRSHTFDSFRSLVCQSELCDQQILNQLSYDKRHEKCIGVERMRQHLLNFIIKSFQQCAPAFRQHHRTLKTGLEKELSGVVQQQSSLSPQQLRGTAMNYVTQLVHTVEKLVQGRLEGISSQWGQTLAEEKLEENGGEWVARVGSPLKLDIHSDVPAWDRPLLGRQQVERLLAEFRIILKNVSPEDYSDDDVLTAAGSRKLNNPDCICWVAAELAQHSIDRMLVPLVKQLTHRAVYIMTSLAAIARMSLKAAARKGTRTRVGAPTAEISYEDYPFFFHWVSEHYRELVEQLGHNFEVQCQEEFACTALVTWESSRRTLERAVTDEGNPLSQMKRLSRHVFKQLRNRLGQNVLLKCHKSFLESSHIWGSIQSTLSMKLTDALLEELFEVNSTCRHLEAERKRLESELQEMQVSETRLSGALSSLSRK